MDATETRVYSISLLHGLRRSLPCLKCDLSKFSGDAWRAQLIKPPIRLDVEIIFPADFPKVFRRRFSDLPGQKLYPSSVDDHTEAIDCATGEEAGQSRKREARFKSAPPPIDVPQSLVDQRDAGFEHFLETVPSPTHKRVTAGGRVVPAEPGSVSPVATNRTPLNPATVGPQELHPVYWHCDPGRTPVIYQAIGPVSALNHQSYIHSLQGPSMSVNGPLSEGQPAKGQTPFRPMKEQQGKASSDFSASPLMDITNRPGVPHPEYELEQHVRNLQIRAHQIKMALNGSVGMTHEQYVALNSEHETIVTQIESLRAHIKQKQAERAKALEAQSELARLARVNGTGPHNLDGDVPQKNVEWWSSNLMTDGRAFLSHVPHFHQSAMTSGNGSEVYHLPGYAGQENSGWSPARRMDAGGLVPGNPPQFYQVNGQDVGLLSSPSGSHDHNTLSYTPEASLRSSAANPHSDFNSLTQAEDAMLRASRQSHGSQRPSYAFGLDGSGPITDDVLPNDPTPESHSRTASFSRQIPSTFSEPDQAHGDIDTFQAQFAAVEVLRKANLQNEFANQSSEGTLELTPVHSVVSVNEKLNNTASSIVSHLASSSLKSAPLVSFMSSESNATYIVNHAAEPNIQTTDLKPEIEPGLQDIPDMAKRGASKRKSEAVLGSQSAEGNLRRIHGKDAAKVTTSFAHEAMKEQNKGIIKDDDRPRGLLDAMLKDPRYSIVNSKAEASNRAARKEIVGQPDWLTSQSSLTGGSNTWSKLIVGAKNSASGAQARTDMATNADVSGRAYKPNSTPVSTHTGDMIMGDGKLENTSGLQTSSATPTAHKASQPHRITQAHLVEVAAFFDTLRREEEAEIAKYRAEHSL